MWWQSCKQDCPYRVKVEEILLARRQKAMAAPACKGSSAGLVAFQEWVVDLEKKLEEDLKVLGCTCSAFGTTDDENFYSPG